MKIFLYNTTVSQILNILCGFFLQYRSLPSSSTLAILANGPCTFFGPNVCFSAYHIFVGISSSVAMSTSTTILFRYFLLKNYRLSRIFIIEMIFISHLPPLIIPFTASWNFEIVRNQAYQEHSTYDLSIYEPFCGFQNTQSFSFIFATFLIASGAYIVPICACIFVRKIVLLINEHTKMSQNTKKVSRTLVKGLACQTLLPLICYIPIISLYLAAQISGKEILLAEHLLGILTCFPALIDPFISFYFIVPYRIAIVRHRLAARFL
ncbi:unnamed protein product [Caenorhabditis angaria]|uniref:G-protein coupled receptors family 1 profile domain-containing protein n=1 Tax=Caenorhabditis angaria TaxID=860376 RepID=A0A9P1I5L3_9PELO|nr:unnamed protein product [Caenorhabditis angaria]